MAQAQQRRRDALKQALQAALRRLAEDEFGYCMECGEEIEEASCKGNCWMNWTVIVKIMDLNS